MVFARFWKSNCLNAFGADSTFCGMKRFMILLVALLTAVCGCAGSLTDTVNMLKDTPVRALQCYPGQKLGGKFGKDAAFGHWMTPEQKAYVKGLMSSNGFKIIGYGVTGAKDEKGIRAVCEFANFLFPQSRRNRPRACFRYGTKYAANTASRWLSIATRRGAETTITTRKS